MALQQQTEKAVWVGVREEAVRRGAAGGIGRCLPAATGKGCAAPPPCPQLWKESDLLTQQLGRRFKTPDGHLLCPYLVVWQFEKIFFGLPVALPASDFLGKFFGVSGLQSTMWRGERI